MPLSFTLWRHHTINRLSAARAANDRQTADKLRAELRQMHWALGEREIGTAEEQAAYLLARHTRTAVSELAAVGIDTNTWPRPTNSPAVASREPAETVVSPETEQRISDLFAAAGPLHDRQSDATPRFVARYRPQDGQLYQGRPLVWAIWDTASDIAVAHHEDQELAEYQASRASESLGQQRGAP
ncbi:hypothetical protein ACFYZ9_33560 [Streptomyces sp. NPDC001691]|uniref:hypothetical protein n=1 Tax=Streptomyces sp. NPDC001691 TaxID=3364600 RepID=UPI0036B295F1